MTEIFTNISSNVKSTVEAAWNIAAAQKEPAQAVEFLNNFTNYYSHLYTDEEMDFIRFYFNMKMEELKNQ